MRSMYTFSNHHISDNMHTNADTSVICEISAKKTLQSIYVAKWLVQLLEGLALTSD